MRTFDLNMLTAGTHTIVVTAVDAASGGLV
jgi:hypothetical protein